MIEDILHNPSRYTLYGTGSLRHYQSNKLLFSSTLIFLDIKYFAEERINANENTVVVLFTPLEKEIKDKLFATKYRFIELFKFIDYKASIFWGSKGEYKGIDRNHYMSNEVVLKQLEKNIRIFDLIPTDKDISVLSLCCGTGNLERELLKFSNIKLIDAFDISEESLIVAKEKIRNHPNKDIVHYQTANLNNHSFTLEKYDLVLAQECVHHIQNLETLYENVARSMKPKGMFLQFEYVGPNRFQFEDYIISIVNSILRLLPQKLRAKEPYKKTTLFDIIQADPSEAVRATDIIPLTQHYFKNTQIYYHSGTFMHILHQKLNMDYFYTVNSEPKRNLILSTILTKIVFLIERLLLSDRYSHMALLRSYKR